MLPLPVAFTTEAPPVLPRFASHGTKISVHVELLRVSAGATSKFNDAEVKFRQHGPTYPQHDAQTDSPSLPLRVFDSSTSSHS